MKHDDYKRLIFRGKPPSKAETAKFRRQLGDAKPGDYVETDFFIGILPDMGDFTRVQYSQRRSSESNRP